MSQQINLFNPIFLKQKKYFSAVTMAQALGMIVVGSAVVVGYVKYQLMSLDKEAEATAAQLGLVQAQLAKVNASYGERPKSKLLESELAKLEAEVASMQQVTDLLRSGELGNTNGYAEYMRAFSREITDGVWLTGFSIHGAGTDIAIYGRALKADRVPVYISRLKREPVMQGKSFAALDIRTPEQEADGQGAGERRKMPAKYVEFSLRSAGVAKDQPESAGAAGVTGR